MGLEIFNSDTVHHLKTAITPKIFLNTRINMFVDYANSPKIVGVVSSVYGFHFLRLAYDSTQSSN